MKLRLEGRLPYVSVTLAYRQKELHLDRVLLDTGSAGSVFAADLLAPLGIEPESTDRIRRILGVGGSEYVYSKKIDELALGDLKVQDFEIQVGAMSYGFPLDGIVGMDFLLATGIIIDLGVLEIRAA